MPGDGPADLEPGEPQALQHPEHPPVAAHAEHQRVHERGDRQQGDHRGHDVREVADPLDVAQRRLRAAAVGPRCRSPRSAVSMNASTSAPGRRETIAGSPLTISGAISAMRSGVTTAPRPGLASKVSLMIAVPTIVTSTSSPGGDVAERQPITDREVEIVQRQRADGDLPRGGRRPALVDGQRRCLLGDALDRDVGVDPAGLVPDPQVLAPDERGLVDVVSELRVPEQRRDGGLVLERHADRDVPRGAEPRRGCGAGRRGSRRAIPPRRWRRPRRRR